MTVYFDSSVFLSIFNGDKTSKEVKLLLEDLQKGRIRIYTSIITIQEVSVAGYKKGTATNDNYGHVKKMARIEGITRDIALTAARIEAQILDNYKATEKEKDNPRRKWDCFHIATAQHLRCAILYTFDEKMLKRQDLLNVKHLKFSKPEAINPSLFESLQ